MTIANPYIFFLEKDMDKKSLQFFRSHIYSLRTFLLMTVFSFLFLKTTITLTILWANSADDKLTTAYPTRATPFCEKKIVKRSSGDGCRESI